MEAFRCEQPDVFTTKHLGCQARQDTGPIKTVSANGLDMSMKTVARSSFGWLNLILLTQC